MLEACLILAAVMRKMYLPSSPNNLKKLTCAISASTAAYGKSVGAPVIDVSVMTVYYSAHLRELRCSCEVVACLMLSISTILSEVGVRPSDGIGT